VNVGVLLRPCEEVIMNANYTAIVQRRDAWWIGWIEEIPGVNAQAATREELVSDLRSALQEALEMNRADAVAAVGGASFEKVTVSVAG
jgi:predicted RNase H-like HicB family nuclease